MLDALHRATCATCPGSFDDDSVYEQLDAGREASSTRRRGIPFNRVFYLSTAPAFFPVIVGKLGEHGLDKHEAPRCGW